MMRVLLGVIAVLVIGGSAAAGYLIGGEASPSAQEARAARLGAMRATTDSSEREGLTRARARGARAGAQDGRQTGVEAGRREGRQAALAAVPRSAPDPQSPSATQSQAPRPADDEAAERSRNCDEPLFVEGYCPTDEEVEYESKAESLCGGGKHEQAKAEGVACFPPGDPRNP
jgi:hypothetical protein